jgi:hypothetical protein
MLNQETTNPKRKSFKIALAVTIAAIVIISSYTVYALEMNTPATPATSATTADTPNTSNSSNVNPQPRITKGEYATYQGQANIMFIQVTFNARLQVTDINQTHAQITTTINIATPYGSNQNTTTTWIELSNMTFQPDGLTLNSTYTTQVTTTNLGNRTCTVYEYKNQDITAVYYVDNTYHWPIKMTMTSPVVNGQSYSMNVNLVDTNIPGL